MLVMGVLQMGLLTRRERASERLVGSEYNEAENE